MDSRSDRHLSESDLWALLRGELDGVSAEAFESHLTKCPTCLRSFNRVTSALMATAVNEENATEADGTGARALLEPTLPYNVVADATEAYVADAGVNAVGGEGGGAADAIGGLRHPDYEIQRELGRGGMGVVYLAYNKLMGRNEVLKVMGPELVNSGGASARFLREIRAVGQLRHPNIVTAYSTFRSGESLVFAMEYVEGLDLDRMVRARGAMPVRHACHFIYQAALGLQHAHEAGMVHRDIKPSNLMLSHQQERPIVKVLDFGLAKASREQLVSDSLTLDGQVIGTPKYMAPEQIDDAQAADIRADIYSLGCTLYYLLTGRAPFVSSKIYEILHAHHHTIAEPLNSVRSDVSAELASVVARMMAKQPGDRYQTPGEAAEALKPFFKKSEGSGLEPSGRAVSVHVGEPSPAAPVSSLPASELEALEAATRAVAGVAGSPQENDVWSSLIEIDPESTAVSATGKNSERERTSWLVMAASAVAGLSAIVIGAVLVMSNRGGDSTPKVSDPPETVNGRDRSTSVEPVPLPGRGLGHQERAESVAGDRREMPLESAASGESNARPADGIGVTASTTAKAVMPPANGEAAAKPSQAEPSRVVVSEPELARSDRVDWIYGRSVAEFDQWAERMKSRGYRPVFVNGHDLATATKLEDQPDVPGRVRIAAIAIKDALKVPYVIKHETAENGFPTHVEMLKRGYSLCNVATFADGTMARVISIFAHGDYCGTWWYLGSRDFHRSVLMDLDKQGTRPYFVTCRPAGDFWETVVGVGWSHGVKWDFHCDLDLAQLKEKLEKARGLGLRPVGLTEFPGPARGGYGVLLLGDRADLLWDVSLDMKPVELEANLVRMSAKGFVPNEIVGYASRDQSRYMAIWTRDPKLLPATGTGNSDPAIESIDEAFERFVIDHRIPGATIAVCQDTRVVLSRGYGYEAADSREPMGPETTFAVGDISDRMVAAAIHSLLRKKKLSEDISLDELKAKVKGEAGVTVDKGTGAAKKVSEILDFDQASGLEAQGVALASILGSLNTKGPADAVLSEVVRPNRLSARAAVRQVGSPTSGQGVVITASAADLGRFFARHQFDGRPILKRAKLGEGRLVASDARSLIVVLRHDDRVVVAMLKLPVDAKPGSDVLLESTLGPLLVEREVEPGGKVKTP